MPIEAALPLLAILLTLAARLVHESAMAFRCG